jgi:hypothetical protein
MLNTYQGAESAIGETLRISRRLGITRKGNSIFAIHL